VGADTPRTLSRRSTSALTEASDAATVRSQSPAFLAKFGMLAGRMAGQLMIADGDGRPLGDIAMKAMSGGQVAAKDVLIADIDGEERLFIAEAFYNRHNLFVMVTGKKAARFGVRGPGCLRRGSVGSMVHLLLFQRSARVWDEMRAPAGARQPARACPGRRFVPAGG
jgi:hypothetical protein